MKQLDHKMDGNGRIVDDSEYLSTCNICFLNFDLELCRPKVLPCSHTFCFKCLKTMHSFSTLKCPVCCANIDICDVATLPNNIFAQHIIHLNQQLQTAYSQRVLSMLWCFTCDSVAKPGCQDNKHPVWDMSRDAKEIHSKILLAKANLVEAVVKRRQLKDTLETSLTQFKNHAGEIRKQIYDNSQELQRLQDMVGKEPDFNGNRQIVEMRLQETINLLTESVTFTEKWQSRLEALRSDSNKTFQPITNTILGQMQLSDNISQDTAATSNTRKRSANTTAKGSESSSDLVRWKESGLSGSFFAVNCRSVRMGSYKFAPFGRVLLSSKGLILEAPVFDSHEQLSSIWIDTAIPFQEFSKVEVCFDHHVPVIFIYVTQKISRTVSMQLGLSRSPYCWDSLSHQQKEKRLTLLPYSLNNSAKTAIKEAFNSILQEINRDEANQILLMSAPQDLGDVSNRFESDVCKGIPHTSLASCSSMDNSTTSQSGRRITRSATKSANSTKKTAFQDVNHIAPPPKKPKQKK